MFEDWLKIYKKYSLKLGGKHMFTDNHILKIAADVKAGKKRYQELKDSKKYSTEHLWKVKQELETAFKNDLQNYYDSEAERYQAIREEVKETYEKEKVLTSEGATLELLRRQDIDTKLKLASDDDLKEQVKTFTKTGEGEETSLNMLRLELRKRDLIQEDVLLKAYMDEYNISTPYMKDKRYQEALEKTILINQVRHTGYLHIGEGELKEVIPLKIG
jgi:hypothetical protein